MSEAPTSSTVPPIAEASKFVPPSLHEQLVLEANEMRLAEACSKAAASAMPIPSFQVILESEDSYGGIMCGKDAFPGSRLERQMIDEAAANAGVTVQDMGNIFGAADGTVAWDSSDRFQTLRFVDSSGKFRKSLSEILERQRAPFEILASSLRDGATEVVTEESYGLDDANLDMVATFMGYGLDQGISGGLEHSKAELLRRLYALPIHLPGDVQSGRNLTGVYFDEDGNLLKILTEVSGSPGIAHGMYFAEGTRQDPSDVPFRLGVELSVDQVIQELDYNNSELSQPFLLSEAGRAIVEVIDSSKLVLAPRLRNILIGRENHTDYDPRYGSSYSELTRELAKIVNDPNRGVDHLFEGGNIQALKAIDEMDVDKIQPESARQVFSLLSQSLRRSADAELTTDLPATMRSRGMQAGACKDAEYYFLADMKVHEGISYQEVGDSHVPMLHKSSGYDTALSVLPVMYNGVVLPRGSLFQINRQDESTTYTFVRVTAFAFDQDTARDAFGWQYREAISHASGMTISYDLLSDYIR
jgi:hypothetical protein